MVRKHKHNLSLPVGRLAIMGWLSMGLASNCSRKGYNERKIEIKKVEEAVKNKKVNPKGGQPCPDRACRVEPMFNEDVSIPTLQNFTPSPSPQSITVVDGFSGLPNFSGRLYNVCWMNSALQIFAAIYKDRVKGNLKELIDQINSGNPVTYLAIENFRATLQGEPGRLAYSGKQQDPENFIYFLQQDNHKEIDLPPLRYVMPHNLSNHLTLSEVIDNSTILSSKTTSSSSVFNKLIISIKTFSVEGNKIVIPISGTEQISFKKDSGFTAALALQGFIEHIGDRIDRGHYVAYVKRNGRWYYTNDSIIIWVSDQAALEAAQRAYLLFYEQVG